MRIDWKYLLTEARIPWRDRGRNCSRGNVNITCPWCADDPSEHLTINEENGLHYCMRNNMHKGGDAQRLLEACGIRRMQAVALIEDASRDFAPVQAVDRVARAEYLSKFTARWEGFPMLWEGRSHLLYLEHRGFDDPILAAKLFDLRMLPGGAHSMRILIPMYDTKGVSGWSGRTIRNAIPKYLMHCAEPQISVAGVLDARRESLIVVEGPLDALKLNYALRGTRIGAVALCGKNLSPGKILLIRNLRPRHIRVVLDNDASFGQTLRMVNELVANCPGSTVRRGSLPPNRKDPGEMPCEEILDWAPELMRGPV